MAADAHCIAPVPCDEKGYFVFLAKALKKNMVCPVVIKSPAKFCTLHFYSNSLISKSFEIFFIKFLRGFDNGVSGTTGRVTIEKKFLATF